MRQRRLAKNRQAPPRQCSWGRVERANTFVGFRLGFSANLDQGNHLLTRFRPAAGLACTHGANAEKREEKGRPGVETQFTRQWWDVRKHPKRQGLKASSLTRATGLVGLCRVPRGAVFGRTPRAAALSIALGEARRLFGGGAHTKCSTRNFCRGDNRSGARPRWILRVTQRWCVCVSAIRDPASSSTPRRAAGPTHRPKSTCSKG